MTSIFTDFDQSKEIEEFIKKITIAIQDQGVPAGTDGDQSDALSGMDASGVGVEDFECDDGRNAYSWTIFIAKLSSSSIVFSIIGNR